MSMSLARVKKGGANFEISVDPDLAISLKSGKDVDITEVLKSQDIFSDAKKGLLASEERMKSLFETEDTLEIAKKIIMEGEVQVSQEYRDKVREEKKAKIIAMIHKNGVDPRTHAPHPLTRIESAFDEAKVRIDETKPAEDQLSDVLKQLRPVLPISLETKEIELTIGAKHAPKVFSVLKSFGTLIKTEWLSDGSLRGVIEIPAGIEADMYDKLNSMTQGDIHSKVLSTK